MNPFLFRTSTAALATTLLTLSATADRNPDTQPEDLRQLAPFTATALQNPVDTKPPTIRTIQVREDLRSLNMINPEDSLQYSPNLFVRKRFIGDRNGVLAIRGASPFQNGRSLVLADGVLLSNLLENRWNGAPRWQMIAAEEIEAVEVVYGPYAAAHSGNAMNGVISITTRQPVKREATVQTSVFTQQYKDYGTNERFGGYRTFFAYGDRWGALSLYAFYQRLHNKAQPQSLVSRTNMQSPAPDNPRPAVSGVLRDLDPNLRERFILGASGFNESTQDLFKLKAAYAFNPQLRLQATLGYWLTDDDSTRIDNFLRDQDGNPVWAGSFQFDDRVFSVGSGDWGISTRRREDLIAGLTLEGIDLEGWSFQAALTYYDIPRDDLRNSNQNPRDPTYNGSGRIQLFGDTHWLAFDLKVGRDSWWGLDTLSGYIGYHWNHFQFGQREWNSSGYATGLRDGTLRSEQAGRTGLQALFSQFDWVFAPQWTASLGARFEQWEARNGVDFNASSQTRFQHPARRERDLSPKFSLAFQPAPAWSLRLSLARAVRFPVVTELFQGDPDRRNQVIHNPQLKPEAVFAGTVMAKWRLNSGANHTFAYFRHDEEDTIFSQRVFLADGSTISSFVNIDRVLAQGVEWSWFQPRWLHPNLDLAFNASYNHTEILENRVDPSIEGNAVPRVPRWRVNLLNTWRFSDRTQFSAGLRYASSSFNQLDNGDTHSRTFGGISDYLVVNLKLQHTLPRGLTVSAGIDNLTSERYWMAHPFPQRSFLFDATWRF